MTLATIEQDSGQRLLENTHPSTKRVQVDELAMEGSNLLHSQLHIGANECEVDERMYCCESKQSIEFTQEYAHYHIHSDLLPKHHSTEVTL